MITIDEAAKQIMHRRALNKPVIDSAEEFAREVLLTLGFGYHKKLDEIHVAGQGKVGALPEVTEALNAYGWVVYADVTNKQTEYKKSTSTKLELYSMPRDPIHNNSVGVRELADVLRVVIGLSDVIDMNSAARLLRLGADASDIRRALGEGMDTELIESTLT